MEEAQARPHLMVKQDSEQAVNDLLASDPARQAATASSTAATPAATPSASKSSSSSSSSSGPTLKPNRAFRLAVQPYKSDPDLLRTFDLTSSTNTSGDAISAPSFGRLREFHKILAALRGIYSRIHEGRGRLDGASATATAAATNNAAANGVDAGAEAEEGGSSSTTLDKTRCKDAIQRLILSVHYQCEVFTGYRMGGDAILEDSDDDEEELEKGDRKRELEVEGETEGLEDEPGHASATGTSATAKKQRLGPRASDQRSLGEFFTPPTKAQGMKRQQTVRFGPDEQEQEQEQEKLELEGEEQEQGEPADV